MVNVPTTMRARVTMEILPTTVYTSYCTTKTCNQTLAMSFRDGTRIGSPELYKILSIPFVKGPCDPFTTVG